MLGEDADEAEVALGRAQDVLVVWVERVERTRADPVGTRALATYWKAQFLEKNPIALSRVGEELVI